MKPFDIELAKAGRSICDKNGNDVRILCFDRNFESIEQVSYPIVALVNIGNALEKIVEYTEEGFPRIRGNADLMIKTTKKEGWINVYKDNLEYSTMTIYTTKDLAIKNRNENHIATIKIEWEE